jgi:hypothetical protein
MLNIYDEKRYFDLSVHFIIPTLFSVWNIAGL